jgi:cyclase
MPSKTLRWLWLAGIAIFASVAFLATPLHAQTGQVKLVVPGVWFREGDLEGAGEPNNIVIEMKDYLIVVDANLPAGARQTLDAAQRISPKPVKYVINTSAQGDHLYGNPIWTQAGAITLAYAGVAEDMRRFEPGRWLAAGKVHPEIAALHLGAPEPPQQTFEKSPFVLKDSTREVRIYFFGWGHSRGDAFVFLPKEKLLCTGDAAVNGPFNFMADANFANWPKVLRSAETLGAETVLPGHGPAGGPEILDGQTRFLTELRKAVEAAIKSGKKLSDVISSATATVFDTVGPASTSLVLPASVKNWSGLLLAAQVRDTWMEIVEKKPRGDIAVN